MADNSLTREQRQKKKRLEWGAIVVVALVLLLLTLIQRGVLDLGPGLSENQGVITLVSINFSVILMAILILLILRNLYRIFFDHQSYGTLQTKMVVAFISLSLLPTILIFYYSYRLIISGHNLWFSPKIETSLSDALKLSEAVLAQDNRTLTAYGGDILDDLEKRYQSGGLDARKMDAFLVESRLKFHLAAVQFYDPKGQLRQAAGDAPAIPAEWFAAEFGRSPPWTHVVENTQGDFTHLVWPLLPSTIDKRDEPYGFLAIGRMTLAPIRSRMEAVRGTLADYQDALAVQKPFRVTQLAALGGIALLSVFISVWIGAHLARSLARPVLNLVEGTKRVARGDLDFIVGAGARSGELAALVDAFNSMTWELKKSYAELDRRRRFVETVLKNVSTGVIVAGAKGALDSVNQAAMDILGLAEPAARLADLPPAMAELVEELLAVKNGRRVLEKNLRLDINGEARSLAIHIARLRGEEGAELGLLLAFDDLTEAERAQKLSAWREVARRIAHEVKNPLTPIQLAAQRLRRRFGEKLSADEGGAVFDECTSVIIRQVDEMKNLVDEFSQFARLPETKLKPGDFVALLEESLVLFRQAHKKVVFSLDVKERPLIFDFDPEQMRRVMRNLVDNAISAMHGEGRIDIGLELEDDKAGLRLSIKDSGPGIPPEVEGRIFEPYVSYKEGGQGLGLSIVKTIISDHGGFIRVQSSPQGSTFTISMPLRKH